MPVTGTTARLPVAFRFSTRCSGFYRGELIAAVALILVVLPIRARRAFVGVLHIRAVVLRSDFLGHGDFLERRKVWRMNCNRRRDGIRVHASQQQALDVLRLGFTGSAGVSASHP